MSPRPCNPTSKKYMSPESYEQALRQFTRQRTYTTNKLLPRTIPVSNPSSSHTLNPDPPPLRNLRLPHLENPNKVLKTRPSRPIIPINTQPERSQKVHELAFYTNSIPLARAHPHRNLNRTLTIHHIDILIALRKPHNLMVLLVNKRQ